MQCELNAGYRMNTDALCAHTANFRAEIVDEVFGRVGIGGITGRLHMFSPLAEHFQTIYPEVTIATLKSEQKYFHLNDLAERRNEVAHGNASEILSPPILLSYIDIIDAFCVALYELVRSHYYEFVARYSATAIGKALAVYNYHIVCITLNNVGIKVGDTLIAKTGNGVQPYVAGEVLELQIENRPIQSIPPAEAVKVGIRVACRCKASYQYFLAQDVPEA